MSDVVIAYLREQAEVPFVWGRSDCVQFVAGMVERLTGRAYAAEYTYASESDAKAVLASAHGLEGLVTKHLGPMSRDLRACQAGDVVLTAYAPGGQTLGVALPPYFYLRTTAGLKALTLDQAIGFWRA